MIDKKLKLISLLITIFISSFFFFNDYSKNLAIKVFSRIDTELSNKILDNKKKLNFFSNNSNNSFINFYDYETSIYSKIDYLVSNQPSELKISSTHDIKINKNKFREYVWELPFLNYFESNKKPTAFIDDWQNNIIIVSGRGDTNFIKIKELEESIKFDKKLNMTKIQNNLHDLIKDNNFFNRSWISIKDILISQNKIYLSFTDLKESIVDSNVFEISNLEHKDQISLNKGDCYGISILEAEFNFDFLEFEYFFQTEECINSDVPDFTAHLVGGRIIDYKDDLLFSTGDFRVRYLSQDDNSLLGKILLIDREGEYQEIFSKGHRNPQGLFYDEKLDIILSTEHGPWGGDEINIIKKNNNYGWPYASYGKHYCEKTLKRPLDENCKKKYELFPLYKSHSNHGFDEPIKFFNNSIGISEIIKLSSKFSFDEKFNYLASSLSGEKGKILYFFGLSDQFLVKNEFQIPIRQRVRDIMLSSDGNYIFMLKEDSSALSAIY